MSATYCGTANLARATGDENLEDHWDETRKYGSYAGAIHLVRSCGQLTSLWFGADGWHKWQGGPSLARSVREARTRSNAIDVVVGGT